MLITEVVKQVLSSDPRISGMIPGGINLSFRPEKGTWPYLVVQLRDNPITEFWSERAFKEEPVLVVKVYTEGVRNEDQAGRIIEEIQVKLLATRPLPFDGTGSCQCLFPTQGPIVAYEPVNDRAPDAGFVCAGSTVFRAEVWRSLP